MHARQALGAARAFAARLKNASSLAGVAAALAIGRDQIGRTPDYAPDAAIVILSDSTGVRPTPSTGWPHRLASLLAAAYPTHCVVFRVWNDSTQDYDGYETIQAGPLGQRRLNFGNAALGTAAPRNLAATEIGDITGDLDVSLDLTMDDWTPAAETSLCGRWGSAPNQGWRLRVTTAGLLKLYWSTTGTDSVSATSSVAPTVSDGGRLEIRVTLDVDNGAAGKTVTFYTRASGATTWVQLGSAVTAALTTSVYNPAGRIYEVGGASNAAMAGNIYAIAIRQGILGPVMNPQPISTWNTNSVVSPLLGSPTLYVINGAKSGADIAYLTDATRLPKMLPRYQPCLAIFSDGHNDFALSGAAWPAALDTLLTAAKARLTMADFAIITQNPRNSVATFQQEHALKMRQAMAWARRNGVTPIDTFRAMLDAASAGIPLSAQIDPADGIHELDPGAIVQAQTVFDAIAGFI